MSEEYEQNEEILSDFSLMWIIFTALSGPFLLLPVELWFPSPHIVEEIFKMILVLWYLRNEIAEKWSSGVLKMMVVGLLFGLSESVLFLTNAFNSGDFASLGLRLVTAVPMHALTVTIMYIMGRKSKWLIVGGLLIGMVVHYLFNLSV